MGKKYLFINRFYLIIMFVVLSIMLSMLLFGITKMEEQFEEKMLTVTTADIIQITQNSSKIIQNSLNDNEDYVAQIVQDPKLKNCIDDVLAVLLTENIKYAYLLYKDASGVFRFLADGSPVPEKAQVKQKFDVESPMWHEIYATNEPMLIKQPLLHQLSFSYLVPILKNKEVKLVLAIDFSIKKTKDINQIINTVKAIIKSIIFIVFIFIFVLILQLVKYYTMKRSAYTDKLTNLFNRNYLQDIKEYIDTNKYVLAVLDIDHFKKINDTYGHSIGDTVLEKLAESMILSTRSQDDIIIRYGGEEFILLLKKQNKDDETTPLLLIERVVQNIQNLKFAANDKESFSITVSVGVDLHPNESEDFEKSFKLADDALYQAKQNGRNQVVTHARKG